MLTRGATRIEAEKLPLFMQFQVRGTGEVFPSLLLISNVLSVCDTFSLTDVPKKLSLRHAL